MYWVQISSGTGPVECCRVVWHITEMFQKLCEEQEINCELLNCEPAREKKSFRSVLLKIDDDTASLKSHWEGTVLWQSNSPFRPNHRRKNWYVKISFLEIPKDVEFDSELIKIEAIRGGGPGGQHVNKSNTAIRATYLPTGDSVFCHEERSQLMNKKLALSRLNDLILNQNQSQKDNAKANSRMEHYSLERGNPIRTFKRKL